MKKTMLLLPYFFLPGNIPPLLVPSRPTSPGDELMQRLPPYLPFSLLACDRSSGSDLGLKNELLPLHSELMPSGEIRCYA